MLISKAAEEPVIADPYICGGIPVDKTFYALILMSDGVYKCLEEATGTTTANSDIVTMVATELQCQSTLNGVAQAVVDKAGRIHHDAFMQQPTMCQKRDDMTLLIRVFDEQLTTCLSSPRGANRQNSSGMVRCCLLISVTLDIAFLYVFFNINTLCKPALNILVTLKVISLC